MLWSDPPDEPSAEAVRAAAMLRRLRWLLPLSALAALLLLTSR
jgi:hypothetical protein